MWPFKRKQLEQKVSRASPLLTRTGQSSPATWTQLTFENLAKESYLKNALCYRCMNKVGRAVGSVKWKVTTNGEDNPNHWAVPLFTRPNPWESWPFFAEKIVTYILLQGNGWLEKRGAQTGPNNGRPRELYCHRPDRMKIELNKSTGTPGSYKYEYQGQSVTWPADPKTGESNILQIKTVHPLDDWYGLSAVEPAARETDTLNEAIQWNKKMLENDAKPGMVFKMIGLIGDHEREEFEKRINDKYAGADNAGRNVVIGGEQGTGAEPYQLSPKDMDWSEAMLVMARYICGAYGVPPLVVGVPDSTAGVTYRDAWLAFYETTVQHWLELFKGELNNWLFKREPGTQLEFLLDDVPAMEHRRDQLFTRLETASFMTINEKRRLAGLPDDPNGDAIYIPANLIELGAEPTAEEMNEETFTEEAAGT